MQFFRGYGEERERARDRDRNIERHRNPKHFHPGRPDERGKGKLL